MRNWRVPRKTLKVKKGVFEKYEKSQGGYQARIQDFEMGGEFL